MARPQRIKRKYGLPWSGYQSSAPPHMCPPDKATSDGPSSSRRSKDFRYSPLDGKFYRREGMAQKGSSSGILENGTGELTVARCRQMISIRSPSFTDGYPSHCSLWTEEGNNKGCIHFYSTNNSTDHVLGQELGSSLNSVQYPTTVGQPSYMKALPYMRTTDGTIGRFQTLALRAIAAAGSRRMMEAGDQVLTGNLNGTPMRWDKKFNDTDVAVNTWRVWHTGHPSPLGLPLITVGTVNAAGSWTEGDGFYISVAYRFADGSVSMPIIPRDQSDDINYSAGGTNPNHFGFGRIALERTGGFSSRYTHLVWSNIPIGPRDCVGRFLLRTPKNPGKLGSAGQTGTEPSPVDLRITAYISNNTDTTYLDPNGNDLSLVSDPLIVRFDHIMQPPARYMGSADGRLLAGYTKANPVAIYLCPQVNADDTAGVIDDVVYEYKIENNGVLTLYKGANLTALSLLGDDSIQTLVDRINNTVSTGGGGKWFACVAPGADAQASVDAAGVAGSNSNLTGILGTTDYSGDTAGRIRSYSSSYYAPIFFSTTYLANFPTAKSRLFFTAGGPGMPSMAANSWVAGNYRNGQTNWGDLMGTAPLKSGAIVCFSKAIATFENRKGGNSGADEDYRLYELNVGRGCIAWDSITEFNGVVGYLTRDGYVITDGKTEVVISGDVWNPATQTGEWAYEIGQCSEAAESDTDIARFSAKAMGGRLYMSYRLTGSARSAATDANPDSWLVYDFTGSMQYSGLQGLLKTDGAPWGWSTRLTAAASLGPMTEVVTSSGLVRYFASEDSTGLASNGIIYNMETGVLDNASDVVPILWTARDFADHMKKKSVQEAVILYKKAGTGVTLVAYRDGLGTTADASLTLPTSGSNNFTRFQAPLPQAARAPTESIEYRMADSTAGGQTAPSDIWGFETDVLLLDSY